VVTEQHLPLKQRLIVACREEEQGGTQPQKEKRENIVKSIFQGLLPVVTAHMNNSIFKLE